MFPYRLTFSLLLSAVLFSCGSHSSERIKGALGQETGFQKDSSLEAEFARAIQEGSLAKVEEFLEKGVSLELSLTRGRTPLLEAIAWNRRELAEFLIGKGASLTAIDGEGKGAHELVGDNINLKQILDPELKLSIENELFEAIIADESDWIEEVLENKFANPNTFKDGETALTYALKNGSRGAFRPLIKKRSSFHLILNLSLKNALGESPLRLAREKNQKAMEKYLVEKGAEE